LKPKYRATVYMEGITGIPTIYRMTVETAENAMVQHIINGTITKNRTGRITIFERRYRIYDRCLMWKPIKHIYLKGDGTLREEFAVSDHEKLWQNTVTD
jgi:hypothetical protein